MVKSNESLELCGCFINGNGNGKNKIYILSELFELGKDCYEAVNVIYANLERGINEDIGDIIVGGKDAGDKAEECLSAIDKVKIRINESCLVCNLVGERITLLNADDRAVRGVCRIVSEFDESLGLAGALTAY